jgi:hypothetical protein
MCFGGTNDYILVMGMLNAGIFLVNMQASDGQRENEDWG